MHSTDDGWYNFGETHSDGNAFSRCAVTSAWGGELRVGPKLACTSRQSPVIKVGAKLAHILCNNQPDKNNNRDFGSQIGAKRSGASISQVACELAQTNQARIGPEGPLPHYTVGVPLRAPDLPAFASLATVELRSRSRVISPILRFVCIPSSSEKTTCGPCCNTVFPHPPPLPLYYRH